MASRRILLTLLLLFLAVFTTAQQQQAAPTTEPPPLRQVTLPSPLPFNTITHCLPINLVITPSNDTSTYEVYLRAEPAVIDALSLNVTGTTLAIESTADFSSTQPIQMIIRLPSTSLLALNHFGPGSDVYIAPGFNITTTPGEEGGGGGGSFTINSGFSSGQLYVNNMTVPGQLNVQSSGVGSTIFTGTYGTVNAAVDGTGGMYISTVTRGANLNIGGVANAFIETARSSSNDDDDDGGGSGVVITGVSTGINRVVYSGTGARCEVSSPFGSFIQTCERSATIPTPPPLPTYTCGIRVEGEFICSLSGVAYTTSPTRGTAVAGGPGSQPVTIPGFTPILSRTGGGGFQFQGPGQQQAGGVGEGGSTAQSAARGTGAVSAVSVAGPGVAQTGTTVGGETTGFQATTGTTPQQQSTGVSIIRQSTDDGGAVLSASADGLVCQAEDFGELRVPLSGVVAE